jgi:hypothetical protein
MQRRNTLAYFAPLSVTKKKGFTRLTLGVNDIKRFFFATYGETKYARVFVFGLFKFVPHLYIRQEPTQLEQLSLLPIPTNIRID